MTETKQKLTLSVDAKTVERAKALGINISDLTGQVLESFTLKPEDVAEDALQRQRNLLLSEMVPMLKKLDAEVHVGVIEDPNGEPGEDYLDVVFSGGGRPQVLAPDEDGEYIRADPSEYDGAIYFDPPRAIVDHFMEAIANAKAKRREEVASYALARTIVAAVTKVETGGPPGSVSGAKMQAHPVRQRAKSRRSK